MKTDVDESELRAAFNARFDTVAPEREWRLRTFDYRSRATRRRRLWAAMGTGGTALTGAAVAAIVMLSSGASIAEGWTSVPSPPSAAAVAAATASCNRVKSGNGPPALTGSPVLTDGRGPYTAAIYVNGQAAYVCLADGPNAMTVGYDNLAADEAPGPDQIGPYSGFGGGPLSSSASPNPTLADEARNWSGLAGSDVSAVTFAFADGSTVEATVENGWYFAWWPGDGRPISVQVTTTSNGTLTSSVGCPPNTSGCLFAGSNTADQ